MKNKSFAERQKNYINLFIKFLIKRGIYDKFLFNLSMRIHHINIYNLTNDLKSVDAEAFIDRALVWLLTPEGENFWRKIDCEWRRNIRQMNHSLR